MVFRRLSEEQFRKLHKASLHVLEKTGVRILEPRAIEIFKKGGCKITDNNLVTVPVKLVEWALDVSPKEITIYDQKGSPALILSGKKAFYGNGSDLLFIIDHRTGNIRKAILKDVIEIVSLIDRLQTMDFVMSGFIPSDIHEKKVQRLQMLTMLDYTHKPIIYVTTDLQNTRWNVKMAEIVAEGSDTLRKRPFAANYINISDPLQHNPESLKKLIWLSEKGLPFIYRPSIVTRGLSTPVTWAGFLVVNNVAGLAGLVLSQLVREGAPFIRCGCGGGTFDMKNMVGLHAAPELRGFNEDMAGFYRLPRFGIGGVTGSKIVDQQAAYEAALTLITATLSGAQLIHDVGYMDNGRIGSFEQLIICDEIIGWIKQYMKELIISEETLALELIDKVVKGGGDFLQSDNMLKHYGDDYYPELTERMGYEKWKEKGSLDLRDRARAKVENILNTGLKSYLSEKKRKKLKEIVEM